MKNIVLGIIAHVDAGKTTLSEAMLYESGAIDRLGRVDKRDAHLDTHALERERGITVFTKQAVFDIGDTHVTLIDTPGHVDFSCETERSLSVQDYAILVVSATDGVTAHTRTLWGLLRARRIPTFIFVNKTDISTRIRRELYEELRQVLSPRCVDFLRADTEGLHEDIASLDERLMAEYFDTGSLSCDSIADAIRASAVFPCFFGSALRMKGVGELLSAIDRYTRATEYSSDMFGARIYKIARDKNGRRMSLAKITGGTLRPKDMIEIRVGGSFVTEKVEELRVISQDKSKPVKEAERGTVVAIYGPESTKAGMGLGTEAADTSVLTPALCYRMLLPDGIDAYATYIRLSELAEEEPSLALSYESESREIRVSLMGEIQLEVLKRLVLDRLGLAVEFDGGRILYRETVGATVRGAGHFEPLGHYAEVHIEIEPLAEGSGIITDTDCDREVLALNWQRLILTHLEERVHRGRLIGAPLTDARITVKGGRAHKEHTVGGDFREATYRAVRQAMMKCEAVLLEPSFDFRAELPSQYVGRLLTDISNMYGEVTDTEIQADTTVVTGICPVSTMRDYAGTLRAYTRGYGTLTLTPGAYLPAHNTDEVIAEYGYDPELDADNPSGSVFCKAGAGYSVPWQEADEKMHAPPRDEAEAEADDGEAVPYRARAVKYGGTAEEDKELMRIFEATYGKVKRREVKERTVNAAKEEPRKKKKPPTKRGDEYVILDGYNVIHAWGELKAASEIDFSLARETLIRLMCSYSAFRRCRVIIVFDAYMVKDGAGSVEHIGNVTVVYTKERQTADAYIERATYEIAPTNVVRVVTSDLDEQFIILGNGALRVSPREFRDELEATSLEIKEAIEKYKKK